MQHDRGKPDPKYVEHVVVLPANLAVRIDEAADKAGISFDSWLAQTVALRFLSETQRMAIAEWERIAGPLTEKQIAEGLMRAWSTLGVAIP